jgi:hypothetical protein
MSLRHYLGSVVAAVTLMSGVIGTSSQASGLSPAHRSAAGAAKGSERSSGSLAATTQDTQPRDPALGQGGTVVIGGHYGALSVHVTFESMNIAPGSQINPPDGVATTVDGYTFTPGPNNAGGFNDSHFGNAVTFWGWNGTTVMYNHDDVIMTKAGGGSFSLVAFDFAGFPPNAEVAFTVTGQPGNVTQHFTPDGVVDGPGQAPDFQTFNLPPSFANVTSVTWEQSGQGTISGLFGLDNIETDVPTPARSSSWSRIKQLFR